LYGRAPKNIQKNIMLIINDLRNQG